MPNRNLTSEELKLANDLLAAIRRRLTSLAAGDPLLLFAYRRKVVKELGYDERGKPGARAKLKNLKWGSRTAANVFTAVKICFLSIPNSTARTLSTDTP